MVFDVRFSGSHQGTKPALAQVPEDHMGAELFIK